eukprot:gnl/TRDRNA2_/TRDRNA2_150279_c0_seq5.p1 gnl/TRDRNA2_/TRDRNA2_150279_c0~~gnl/TRDRNA2_/TRDRNA2_150279_c0_seq5.p1  ORF type:complete len:507 (-),score=60.16 gnl/TRDRNA2_/TRDRNA2_150279_c0_seq5:257-1777(-)
MLCIVYASPHCVDDRCLQIPSADLCTGSYSTACPRQPHGYTSCRRGEVALPKLTKATPAQQTSTLTRSAQRRRFGAGLDKRRMHKTGCRMGRHDWGLGISDITNVAANKMKRRKRPLLSLDPLATTQSTAVTTKVVEQSTASGKQEEKFEGSFRQPGTSVVGSSPRDTLRLAQAHDCEAINLDVATSHPASPTLLSMLLSADGFEHQLLSAHGFEHHVAGLLGAIPFFAPDSSADQQLGVTGADGMLTVAQYIPDVFAHLLRQESMFLPFPNYMEFQTGPSGLNWKMRAILVEWLIQVHTIYGFNCATLFLAVNLLDRYLSCRLVERSQLQLVGIASMLCASKFEQIDPPKACDYVHITDNACSREQIVTMEADLLSTLNFQLAVPTAAHFLGLLVPANCCDPVHCELAHYLVEMSLVSLYFIRYTPSHLVSAALLLSNELLGYCPTWPAKMVQCTQFTHDQLQECSLQLRKLLEAGPLEGCQSITKKYQSKHHYSVANMFICPRP